MTTTETAAEFLTERRDFLHVFVVPSPGDPTGWDVVCRMDGTYFMTKAAAEEIAEATRHRMSNLSDVPMEGRDWWDGPRVDVRS